MADEGGKRNKWLSHVKKTMKAHKGKSFKAVLKMAKKTYKGGAEGGPQPFYDFGATADITTSRSSAGDLKAPIQDAAPVGGRRKSRRGGGSIPGKAVGGRRRRHTRKH
jgi:hypothetical protein